MLDTIQRYLSGLTEERWRRALRIPIQAIGDRYSSQPLRTAGLVIKAGGGVLAKIGAADYYGVAKGVPVTIPAATDMTALTGLVISATFFNVACFFVDSASVVTVAFGTQGATLGALQWPQFPTNKALVGFLIITHSSTFTGNTTPLDTATTVYVSPVGAFDPTVLIA
jgi:hypothetical protein